MSGASRKHDSLAFRLSGLLMQHLEGKECEGHTSDMRVLAQESGLYTYPDLSVVCGEPKFADAHVDTLLNPVLLVEILSPSTEQYDRGAKTKLYREIPSLRECLLISQIRPEAELYRRQGDGSWRLIDAKGIDSSIELTSIGYALRLCNLYRKILPVDLAG